MGTIYSLWPACLYSLWRRASLAARLARFRSIAHSAHRLARPAIAQPRQSHAIVKLDYPVPPTFILGEKFAGTHLYKISGLEKLPIGQLTHRRVGGCRPRLMMGWK